YQYDVTGSQVQRSTVLLACSLSSLSPRMRLLEKLLEEGSPRISQDPQALRQKFAQADQGPAMAGVKLEFWSQPGQIRAPTQVMRVFLPPEEGGGDSSRERQPRFNGALIPWARLPSQVDNIPEQVELGSRLRTLFAKPFLEYFLTSGKPR